jgi:hypothetical protein
MWQGGDYSMRDEISINNWDQKLQIPVSFLRSWRFLMRQVSTSLAKSTAKNCRICGWEKPQEIWQHERDSSKLSVWCVIRNSYIIGPFFFFFFFYEGTENVECYRTMLQDFHIPELRQLNLLNRTFFFQQDGAPCHLASNERQLRNEDFLDKSKGRAGTIFGPLCWLMTPLDSFLRSHVKTGVYSSTQRSSVELTVRITNAIYEISEH